MLPPLKPEQPVHQFLLCADTALVRGIQPGTHKHCQVGMPFCFTEKATEPVSADNSDEGDKTSSRHHGRTPQSPAVSKEQDTVTADQLCEHCGGTVPSYKSHHIIKRTGVAIRHLCVACRLQLS
ncbi:hypothetical protein HispidOSU_010775 [Sigmodon hispidus]